VSGDEAFDPDVARERRCGILAPHAVACVVVGSASIAARQQARGEFGSLASEQPAAA